jgi:hypothetical protein
MSTSSTRHRKAASWLNAAVLVLAFTACCVLGVMMTTRVHTRKDVTATREHELSPRTRQLLAGLDRDLTLVVAADFKAIDAATYNRTRDVLELFDTGRLKVSMVDTSSDKGQQEYEKVIAGLADRDRFTIEAATAAVAEAAKRAEALAAALDTVQTLLLDVKNKQVRDPNAKPGDSYLSTNAATVRIAMQDLRVAAKNARAQLTAVDAITHVPAIDKAIAELKKPVDAGSTVAARLGDDFDSLAKDPASSEADKAVAGQLLAPLRAARNGAGSLSADLAGIDVPRVLKIARALQIRRAALLIDNNAKPGSIGVRPIDVDTLLAAGGPGVDLRARTEDAVAGALAAMSSGVHPIVCIVHGAPTRLAANDWPMLRRVGQQLSMRGIDMVEWAVAVDRDMPPYLAADSPSRPVVFVTITAGSGNNPQAAAAGTVAFSKALNALIASGRNVLLSVNPSHVPGTGSPDPFTECLTPLGIEVDSGRPLLQTEKVDTRMATVPRQDVFDPHAIHAISSAISGLRLRLQWPVPINPPKAAVNVRAEAVVTVPADGTRWAESEWQEFYSAVARLKGDYTQIGNPPTKDSPRDGTATGSSWTLAMAVENDAPGHPRQRVVVVGANGWFLDDLTDAQGEYDGRLIPFFPGNLQLLESSVHWLAGQDDQILRGAVIGGNVTIPAMSPAQQAWLRWLLIAILPALALAAGVAYRALRP